VKAALIVTIDVPCRRWYGRRRSWLVVEYVVADDKDFYMSTELISGWIPPHEPVCITSKIT